MRLRPNSVVRDSVVNVGAAGAFISPLWLPKLEQASFIAAKIAPILGVSWLALQIIVKLWDTYRKWKLQNELRTRLQKPEEP